MLRNLIVPAIITGAIAVPFVWPLDSGSIDQVSVSSDAVQNGYSGQNGTGGAFPLQASTTHASSPFRMANAKAGNHSASMVGYSNSLDPSNANSAVTTGMPNAFGGDASWAGPILDEHGNVIGFVPAGGANGATMVNTMGMEPDFGSAQSFTLPGTAVGPDFSAQPMPFSPVFDFAEVFNFGMTSDAMRQRWNRVSNAPSVDGMRGQRVALVTGTNSWDLHGSLTYYFDEYQKCKRITFRGWSGDANRLVQFLQQNYSFKQQPTRWAGFYLAKSWRKSTGGLLMRNPAVTYKENRVQQVGLLLEINHSAAGLQLSQDFQQLILGSQQ